MGKLIRKMDKDNTWTVDQLQSYLIDEENARELSSQLTLHTMTVMVKLV